VFKNVMENSLRYLNIEPDKEEEVAHVETHVFPDVIEKTTKEIKKTFNDMGLEPVIVGDGTKIVNANFEKNDLLYKNQKVILITDKPKMPDVTGWSQRDVLQLIRLLDIDIETTGNGYAVKQSIKEGIVL